MINTKPKRFLQHLHPSLRVTKELKTFNRAVKNSERDLLRLSADRFMQQYPSLMKLSTKLEKYEAGGSSSAQGSDEGDGSAKGGRA